MSCLLITVESIKKIGFDDFQSIYTLAHYRHHDVPHFLKTLIKRWTVAKNLR